MRPAIRYTLFSSWFTLLFLTCANAQVPATLSVTSVLQDDGGERLEGNFVFTFRLYDADEGETALWEETQGMAVQNGILQATLGTVEPLDLPFDTTYWLGVSVNSGEELSPRIPMTSSAYSIMSKYVADEAVAAGDNVSVSRNESNQLVISAAGPGEPVVGNRLNAEDGSPENAVFVDAQGRVGINTTSPGQALTVNGVVQSQTGGFRFPDGTTQTTAASSGTPSPWETSGSNIFYNTGRVGIGDNSPVATLTVGNGDKLQVHGSDGDVVFKDDQGSLRFANANGANTPMIEMFTSGTNNATRMLVAHSSNFSSWGIAYNDTSDAFTWVGDNIPVLHVQLAGQQRLGVGTNAPEAKLHVETNSATGAGHIKLTEIGFDFSRITFNNTDQETFWDIAARTDLTAQNSRFNIFHSIGGNVFSVTGANNVGVNEEDPEWPLDINGVGKERSVNIRNTVPARSTSSFNYGLVAELDQEAGGAASHLIPVYGRSTDADASISYGVFGHATNASRYNYGVYGSAATDNGYAGYFSGSTFSTGLYLPSDAKLKTEIQPVEAGLSKVMALNPRTSRYDTRTYKAMNLPEGLQYGLLAEEVKAVMPELVKSSFQPFDELTSESTGEDGVEFEAVNYVALIPLLVSAIQEQQTTIASLQAEVQSMKAAQNR